MKVALLTLNYNGKQDTLELLESLKGLRAPEGEEDCELKTIVVDNASEDGSVSAIHKAFPKVDILQTTKNLGYSGGFNFGIKYALLGGADFVFLINNDCKISDQNLISELLKTFKLDTQIGLVSPKIYFAKGFEFHKDKYSKDQLGKVLYFAGGEFDWDNINSIHFGIDEVDTGKYDLVKESEIFSGAAVLIKKEVFERVGFLNEDYFLYFEDSEFAKRAKDENFKIYYSGQTSLYHKVSQSTEAGSDLVDYYHSRNRLIFGMEYGKFRTKFALIREAVKNLVFGRPFQKMGIWDYFFCQKGGLDKILPPTKNFEYCLKLSIGIVNYNTADLTKKLLESIFNKNSGFNDNTMEVIVLDNGDEDPALPKIKEFLPKIKYLKNNQNEGFSKGYNKTINFSQGEYYLMLNSDIEVLEGSLKELLKAAESFGGKAVLGGKLVFPDGSNQDSAFHLPTITGAFKEYFLAQKGAYFMYEPKGENPTKVEGLAMACLLIPKKVLKKIGLLDETTFIFFEDIEYARRLKRFNVPTYFVPTARFIHHHGASTKRIGTDKAVNHLTRASKNYHGQIYYFFLSWVLRIGQKLGRVKTPVSRWTTK